MEVIFLSTIAGADDQIARRFLDDEHVAWKFVPFGDRAFEGWLQYLAENASSDDLAILLTTAGSGPVWSEEEQSQARELAAKVPCGRAVLVDVRRASESVAKPYTAMLEGVGEIFAFATFDDLTAILHHVTKPYLGTAPPPPPPPPPRSTSAGVVGRGVTDAPAKNDTLGFEPYVNAVAAFLAHPQTGVPLTISIEGPWGSGKSSFLEQLESRLKGEFLTIRFNAWRHEKAEELWAAFALLLVERIQPKQWWHRWRANARLWSRRFDLSAGWRDLLRVAAWVFVLAAATITLGTMAVTEGLDELQALAGGDKSTLAEILGHWFGPALGIGGWLAGAVALLAMWRKFFGGLKSPLEIDLQQYLRRPDYAAKVSFLERFQSDLRDVTAAYAPDGKRVFVFIDDLDRAELPQAAELMRAINLMLSDSGPFVFVIGMDREKVAAALAVKHEKLLPFLTTDAPHLDAPQPPDTLRGIFFGYEFIEKFIQIPFAVPEPSDANLESYLSSLSTPKAPPPPGRSSGASSGPPPPATPGSSNQRPVDGARPQSRPQPKLHTFVQPLEEESEHLLAIARRIAPALGNNPRRLKQFVNLFRLRVVIAFATDLFVAPEQTPPAEQITLEKIAKFIAIELRWPLLVAHAEMEPELLSALEQVASGSSAAQTFRVLYWSRYAELMTLLRVGIQDDDRDDWILGRLDLTKLTSVSVKKPRPPSDTPTPDAALENLFEVIAEVDLLEQQNLHEEAVERLLEVEHLASREPLILQRLGFHLLWGSPERALEYSTRYLQMRPSDPSAMFNSACALAQLERREESLGFLRRAIEGNPLYRKRAAELRAEDFRSLASDPEFLALIHERGSSDKA